MNGWWKFHRGYWDIISRFSHAQIAVCVYVFNMANNKDRDWWDGRSRITIKKGSFVDSQSKIAEACSTTRQVVRDALSQLQQYGLITIGYFDSEKNQVRTNRSTNEGTKRYSLISVIESPVLPGYVIEEEPSKEPSEVPEKNQARTTTGEGEEIKKERKEQLHCEAGASRNGHEARAVLDFLNRKAGRNYRPSDTNLDFIRARLKSGIADWQLKAIVSRKVTEWRGTEQEKYLRPATLFNKTKCEQYLGELPREDADELPGVRSGTA